MVCGLTQAGSPTASPEHRCPAKFRTSSPVAVDGTDLETWGALHGDCTTVEFDGEAAETQLMEKTPTKRKAVRKARGLGVGRDGRKQYTVDPDARAGLGPRPTAGRRGPTSGSSCTWPCRPRTCGGPMGSSGRRWGQRSLA